ncbi:Uncharacterised protein [Segatella copri]|nr:Uncharacterised protein [Segatella copri]
MEDLTAHRTARSRQTGFLYADDTAVAWRIGREVACETDEIAGSATLISTGTF